MSFAHPGGSRQLVQLLNMSLEGHLHQAGLFVDKKRKRAYFPKDEDGPRVVHYQARLRRATRTVPESRIEQTKCFIGNIKHSAIGLSVMAMCGF
jgi:hypothetical protein